MSDNAWLPRINSRPPVIQLILSFCFVVVAGTLLSQFFLFIGSLIFHTDIPGLINFTETGSDRTGRPKIQFVQVAQQTGLFLLPALILSYFLRNNGQTFLKIGMAPRILSLILILMLGLVLLPVINITGELNSKMVLPEYFSGLQEWMENKESTASHLTSLLILSDGKASLPLNILILAVVPAFCEEVLFRGLFQQLACRTFNSSHAGIWFTALIFSTIHLQFFGFLPRLILGLVFGYLFFWSGNLWYPVAAHFVNNLVPVLFASQRGLDYATGRMNELTGKSVLPAAIIISSALLYYFWKESKSRPGTGDTVSPDEGSRLI